MNFARDVVEAAPPAARALVSLDRGGRPARVERSARSRARSGALAARLHAHGVRRGDVVLTLIGNRPEWVLTMVACFRQGFVVLPCNEQLRAKDLRCASTPRGRRSSSADERNAGVLREAAGAARRSWSPARSPHDGEPPPPAELAPRTRA